MAGVDGILTIAVERGADELRLATDRAPRAFKRGSPVRLSVPETTDETLRYLLGSLLDDARETELRAKGKLEVPYSSGDGTPYRVTISIVANGIEAIFARSAAPAI